MGQISSISRTFIEVELVWNQRTEKVKAFIDSGAVECFVDADWARGINLPVRSLDVVQSVTALDGRPLGSGVVKEVTDYIHMYMAPAGHAERIKFFLVDSNWVGEIA